MRAQSAPIAYVLDDDQIFIRLAQAVLKKYGISCEAFSSSPAFLYRLKERLPTFCIIDLNVEAKDSSLDLLKIVRNELPHSLPIIMTSGNSDRASIAHAMEAGANDYLLKPLEREILISKLMRFTRSQELDNAVLGFVSDPELDLRVSLELSAKLLEIDELGLTIASPNLISKGTVLSISCPIIQNISRREKPVLVTASSTWVQKENDGYGAYLEFDITDGELLQNVRTWLAQKTNRAS